MIDPETGLFWASWQHDGDGVPNPGVLENIELVGADAAVGWGRARAETVIIRLGHRHHDFFRPATCRPRARTVRFRLGHP